MITAHVESFTKCAPELERIFPLHYDELALDQDKVPLIPRWDQYAVLEQMGVVFFMTIRQAGELIGYYVGFIQPHMHYATCLTCITDLFYVRPDTRKAGAGSVLFNAVEVELKRRGVSRWVVGYKDHLPAGKFLEQHGLMPIERVHSKWIGG